MSKKKLPEQLVTNKVTVASEMHLMEIDSTRFILELHNQSWAQAVISVLERLSTKAFNVCLA